MSPSVRLGMMGFLTPAQWQGRDAARLADYSGFQDRNKFISASLQDTMPVYELDDVAPIVADYMDTQAGPLCYTYSST